MAGLVITFLTILSMPIFSVSVLPIMHSPSGLDLDSFSSSLALASTETATEADLSSTVYSPETVGHEFLLTSNSQLDSVEEARDGNFEVSLVIASAGMQYLHPKQGYSRGSSFAWHSFTPLNKSLASLILIDGSDAFRFSSVPLMQPHFLHLESLMPFSSSEET